MINTEDFNKIYEIIDESFPKNEKRSCNDQHSIMNSHNCETKIYRNTNGEIITFLIIWNFDNFYFLEYFATDKKYRNQGLGKKFLNSYLKDLKKPLIIEVELPDKELSKRRINFYKKLGFHLNDYNYKQPALQKGSKEIDLLIMSYPNSISEREFKKFKKEIYKNVYKIQY